MDCFNGRMSASAERLSFVLLGDGQIAGFIPSGTDNKRTGDRFRATMVAGLDLALERY